ncbi:hypothetical protein GCM10011357_15240 [Lacimicrobium alkaliphilum]|uniref:Uncharacterized protein n=2 Tax=Lacimicrobium alkaliphilum TaxID=1526571 RepID=A0ABQ1R916_9ALTE|nr:hypothetical protein GCM10011357_15240 [Lacimicrobium alkaliphilum]
MYKHSIDIDLFDLTEKVKGKINLKLTSPAFFYDLSLMCFSIKKPSLIFDFLRYARHRDWIDSKLIKPVTNEDRGKEVLLRLLLQEEFTEIASNVWKEELKSYSVHKMEHDKDSLRNIIKIDDLDEKIIDRILTISTTVLDTRIGREIISSINKPTNFYEKSVTDDGDITKIDRISSWPGLGLFKSAEGKEYKFRKILSILCAQKMLEIKSLDESKSLPLYGSVTYEECTIAHVSSDVISKYQKITIHPSTLYKAYSEAMNNSFKNRFKVWELFVIKNHLAHLPWHHFQCVDIEMT